MIRILRILQLFHAPHREIRFSVGPEPAGPVHNSWGGWPAAADVAPFLILRGTLQGQPDARTGYICNIKVLDQHLRDHAIRFINANWHMYSEMAQFSATLDDAAVSTTISRSVLGPRSPLRLTVEATLKWLASALEPFAPGSTRWVQWELRLTPYLSYSILADDDMIRMTRTFEFSASHRLHVPSMSDEANRRVFGKCNNPNGHGHNYQLEVTIAGDAKGPAGVVFPLVELDRMVKDRVVDRLDHKHLNADCPEFASLNPSVENITQVVWSLLEGQFAPARLARVRVWETAKTYAEIGEP